MAADGSLMVRRLRRLELGDRATVAANLLKHKKVPGYLPTNSSIDPFRTLGERKDRPSGWHTPPGSLPLGLALA